jgi:hypothetical protein
MFNNGKKRVGTEYLCRRSVESDKEELSGTVCQ